MKRMLRALLSLVLCCSSLVSLLCLGVSAASDENLIEFQNLNKWQHQANGTFTATFSYDTGCRIDLPRGTGNSTSYYSYYFYQLEDLSLKDEYEFSFEYMSNNMNTYDIQACLFLISPNGSISSTHGVIADISTPTGSSTYVRYKCRFIPEQLLQINSGYNLAIGFYFHGGNLSSSATNSCWIRDISLYNKEKHLLDGLYNFVGYIGVVLDEAFCKIVGGTTAGGVTYNGYFNDLSNWLSNVKDGIVNKLETVKTGIVTAIGNIQGWLSDVKQGIVDKLHNVVTLINNKLESVKDNLLNGIRDFFIPSTNFFSSYLSQWTTWLEAHFGSLYQLPHELLNFFRACFNVVFNNSGTPVFSLPHLYLDIPTGNGSFRIEIFEGTETINLQQLINNHSSLQFMYSLYSGMVAVIYLLGISYFAEKVLRRIEEN